MTAANKPYELLECPDVFRVCCVVILVESDLHTWLASPVQDENLVDGGQIVVNQLQLHDDTLQ